MACPVYQATLGPFPLAIQIAGAVGGLVVAAAALLLLRRTQARSDDRHSPANWARAGVLGKSWGPDWSDRGVALGFALGLLLLSALLGGRVPEWLNRVLDGTEGHLELVPIREVETGRPRRLPATQVAIGPAPTAHAPDIRLPIPVGTPDVVGRCMAIRVHAGALGIAWFETQGLLTDCPAGAPHGISSDESP